MVEIPQLGDRGLIYKVEIDNGVSLCANIPHTSAVFQSHHLISIGGSKLILFVLPHINMMPKTADTTNHLVHGQSVLTLALGSNQGQIQAEVAPMSTISPK